MARARPSSRSVPTGRPVRPCSSPIRTWPITSSWPGRPTAVGSPSLARSPIRSAVDRRSSSSMPTGPTSSRSPRTRLTTTARRGPRIARRSRSRQDAVDPAARRSDSNVVVTSGGGSGATVLGPGANPVWSPDGLAGRHDGHGRRLHPPLGAGARRQRPAPGQRHASLHRHHLPGLPMGSTWWSPRRAWCWSKSRPESITPLTAEPGSMPTWSIGGTIAFSTTGSASPSVFVIDSDGTNLRRVSADLGFASAPRWSPDGRWLLLGDEDGGSPVAIVELEQRQPDTARERGRRGPIARLATPPAMKGDPSMGQAHDPPMNNGRRPLIVVALVAAAVPSREPMPISTTVRSTTTISEP